MSDFLIDLNGVKYCLTNIVFDDLKEIIFELIIFLKGIILINLVLDVVIDKILDAPEGRGQVGHLELNAQEILSCKIKI